MKTEDNGKECKGCGVVKPWSSFNKESKSKDGFRGTCVKCIVRGNRERRQEKIARKIKDTTREFHSKHENMSTILLGEGSELKIANTSYTVYFEKENILYARECGRCLELKRSEEFHNSKEGFMGKVTICAKCMAKDKIIRTKNYWAKELKRNKVYLRLINMPTFEVSYYGETSIHFSKNNELIARNCTICSRLKYFTEFHNQIIGLFGKGNVCKTCEVVRYQEYASKEVNKRKRTARDSQRIKRFRQKELSERQKKVASIRNRNWQKNNMGKIIIRQAKRRAKKRYLPNDITTEQYNSTVSYFGRCCALSGDSEGIHADHVIPLHIGHGGTTHENMIPLRDDLNMSKNANHIFEWFNANRERFGLSQAKFDALISYLAEANGMTPKEYRMYVDWCFDNPRDIDDLEMEESA